MVNLVAMEPGSPGIVIGLFILASEAFVAVFTIIFITSIILWDFYKKRRLDSKDEIQLAMNVSCFIFTIVLAYSEFSRILQPDVTKMSHPSPLLTVVSVYFMCSCSWLTASYCFFNFIKIVNFQWPFIHRVRVRIGSVVPWQIVVVEVMSLCVSLLHLLPYRKGHVSYTNSSHISSELMVVDDYMSIFLIILICSPLVLSTITLIPTAAFLRCHMKKMKDTKTSGEVLMYERVAWKMLFFLLLYLMYFLMVILYYFSIFARYIIGYWINLILIFSFIPAVNVVQILGTPHLRTIWKDMISYFTPHREPDTR
ncbi:taste receptor type 2 member 39-like [Hyla sarda]|uniref:taste receptor type 2 member 39-like n=1 Tax=Hyla sarda TaxID=327740 RepID=UPI0024C367B4|nr:taste receptor type 2 member 39-like [Hyla sarda]